MNLKEKGLTELDPDYPKKQRQLDKLLGKLKRFPEPNRSTLLGFHDGYSIKVGNQILARKSKTSMFCGALQKTSK